MKYLRGIWKAGMLVIMFITASCAQTGTPSGGPQDVDPPVVLKTEPQNYSTGFDSRKIQITFDEFLDMGNFTKELIVSPPMEEKPEIKLKNKTLIIEFEESLKENATYTFNFGEGIKDLNEGNVLLNYEYVFSTGDRLDSLSVKGTIKNAFDLTVPEPPIFVMLYTELNDSLPYTDIPYYVGRTDKEGNFAVNNLKEGIYKLFVLKDGNNNLLFDQPGENIAFLDSSIMVDPVYFRNIMLESGKYDSADLISDTIELPVDTIGMSKDSIRLLLDSLEQMKPDFNSLFVDLFMFEEDPINQYITDYKRPESYLMQMTFNLPLTDSFVYTPVYPPELDNTGLLVEFGKKRDSLSLFLGDTIKSAYDTVGLGLQYTVLDTLEQPVTAYDTLSFIFRNTTDSKSDKEDKAKDNRRKLDLTTIRNKGKQDIYRDLLFKLETPVQGISESKFELYIIPDSIEIPVPVQPYIDSTHLRRVRISKEWKEEANYKLVMYPGAIYDIYGATNDTMKIQFSVRPVAEYGTLNLTLENVSESCIIEIYERDKLYRRREISEPGTYVFEYMNPNTYRVKIVHDRNGNGMWDTGKYIEGIQPEKVEFLPSELKIRANWDHDISYVLGTNTSPPGSVRETNENQPLF